MSVKFKFDMKDKLDVMDSVTYSVRDFSLDVTLDYPAIDTGLQGSINSTIGINEDSFIIVFDSLSIVFKDRKLVSIDAYTNMGSWESARFDIPDNISAGDCYIEHNLSDDRVSFDTVPLYLFNKEGSLLKIEINKHKEETFCQLTKNIIIGVFDGQLSSMFIKNLEMI